MKFKPTEIADVVSIQPDIFGDQRGFFMETYQQQRFSENGISTQFIQDNHSGSKKGILRGLHYQIRQPQGKLVRVVVGEVFDVAVDLRRSSRTFGQWVGQLLSSENRLQLWIPPGFAHGFYVLSDWAEVIYKATDYYTPEWDRTLLWCDQDLGIQWPIPPGSLPDLSVKDLHGKPFREAETYDFDVRLD
jgi:dTDP-4-dehydrorhamnose 3,5-epimerase